jgi:hypothetical protein
MDPADIRRAAAAAALDSLRRRWILRTSEDLHQQPSASPSTPAPPRIAEPAEPAAIVRRSLSFSRPARTPAPSSAVPATAERAASSEAPPPPSSSSAVARPSLLSPALTPATVARRDERESTTALRVARRDERESGTASRDAPTIGSADDRAALNAALRPRRPELARRDAQLAQRDAELAQRDAPVQAPARKRAHVRSIKLSPEHPSIYYL